MATVYSLICWGGSTGKQITTMDTSANTFSSTNHGVRSGTAVQFSSGTLPTVSGTALALNTTYYAKPHASDANKFYMYYDAGLTSQIDMTGGSVSAYLKSKIMLDYVAAYPTRWSTRIYDGVASWNTGRAGASPFDDEVAEIAEAFDEIRGATLTLSVPSLTILITPKIDGARTGGFHAGARGTGFRMVGKYDYGMYLVILRDYRCELEGFSLVSEGAGAHTLAYIGINSGIRGMMLYGYNKLNVGADLYSYGSYVIGSLIENCSSGVMVEYAKNATLAAHNTCVNNAYGFNYSSASIKGFFYNNLCFGNTTANWRTGWSGIEGANGNAGLSGEGWVTGAGSSVTVATTNFADYAGNNFRPASASSPQVDNAVVFYGMPTSDIAGNEVPNYNNGGPEGADIGCFEFDHGYGNRPASQTYTVTGATVGRIKIAKQSDGTEIYNSTSLPSAEPSTFSAATPVYIYIRKGSGTPYYHPLKLSATIDPVAGLTYDATGLQQEDIAAHDYTGTAVASDWTFNSGTGAIVHASGTTRYNVQDLYSWHQDYYDDTATVDDLPLMHGTTSRIFELINGGTITNADLEDLMGGSIEFEGGTLWSNLWTTDTMAAAHDVYVVQGTSKYTAFWGTGPIDVLLKVSDAGVLRNYGLVDVYARPYGYTYAYYQADLSGGGRNVAPIATLSDATCQAIDPSGYSDVGYTWGSVSLDFGDVHGSQTYYCRIDCNSRPLSEVFAKTMYDCRDVSTATLNSIPGWRYQSAHTGYTANAQAPFGLYSGGIWTVAKGVWLDNVPSGDLTNYILTDDAGNTHQNTVALNQSVTIAGLVVGSRVQIYDTTNATELVNEIASTSVVTWEDPSAPTGDRAIRLRVAYVDGVTAKNFIDANIGTCGTSSSTKDVTYLAAQTDDDVYIANAVDGSLVAGITFTDSTVDKMNIDISAGVDLPDLYAAWVYYAFTETGIATDIDYIQAIDTANYVYSNLVWKNVTSPSVPLKISGGYAWDSITLDPMDLIDTTGGTIFLAPPHVVSKVVTVTGGNVITGSVSDLPSAAETTAAIFAQAQVTPIHSDIRKVNSYTVDGDGHTGTEWGPA